MPAKNRSLLTRHALKVALVYLLVCAIPALLPALFLLLPPETAQMLATGRLNWLRHLYPAVPLRPLNVPGSFHTGLSVLPVLLIEVLLVFLFSAWLLRRVPAAAVEKVSARRWVLLALVVLVWSCLIRVQLLGYFLDGQVEALRAQQAAGGASLETLSRLLLLSHWKTTGVIYASMILWTWLPAWLHSRSLKAPAEAVPVAGAAAPMPRRRSVLFAAFLLGCATVHVVLAQALYMGLWPWVLGQGRPGLSTEDIDVLGLPLTLAQIVLALLACAAAAAFYVRRPRREAAWDARTVVGAVAAGMAAYLLTVFILLAAVWILGVVQPNAAKSFLRQFARDPDSAWGPLIIVNLLAVLLLWAVSAGLRRSPRACGAALGALVLLAGVPGYVAWTLAGTQHGMLGARPGEAITGQLGDARWREMQQWCTGVVETRHGTWLIGRQERPGEVGKYVPDGVPDLSRLIGGASQPGAWRAPKRYGSTPVLTTLARLQEDGTFRLVATVPAVACMAVAPDSETLYLLTDLDQPMPSDAGQMLGQRAVLRSVDHGAQWEWLEAGFMPDTYQKPVFGSDHDVWAWGSEPADDSRSGSLWGTRRADPAPVDGSAGLQTTALFHSADEGRTTVAIRSPESLTAPLSFLQEVTGVPESLIHPPTTNMDRERFVVQVDDTRAYAWISERIAYGTGATRGQLWVTTRGKLVRETPRGPWQVTEVARYPHLGIDKLVTAADRSSHALLVDDAGTWLARLDTDSGDWVARRKTPSLLPGWLAENRLSPRYFWSNGQYQVVSLVGYVRLPRVLSPFSRRDDEISTDPHFYTRDGGRTWRQLAVADYLGIMGLSRQGSKLYWTPGSWYRNKEPVQRHFDLAR